MEKSQCMRPEPPIPRPRKIHGRKEENTKGDNQDVNTGSEQFFDPNVTELPALPQRNVPEGVAKPLPPPRRLLQKSNEVSGVIQESDKDDSFVSIATTFEGWERNIEGNENVSNSNADLECAARTTVNIFNQSVDPFGQDFESIIQKATLRSTAQNDLGKVINTLAASISVEDNHETGDSVDSSSCSSEAESAPSSITAVSSIKHVNNKPINIIHGLESFDQQLSDNAQVQNEPLEFPETEKADQKASVSELNRAKIYEHLSQCKSKVIEESDVQFDKDLARNLQSLHPFTKRTTLPASASSDPGCSINRQSLHEREMPKTLYDQKKILPYHLLYPDPKKSDVICQKLDYPSSENATDSSSDTVNFSLSNSLDSPPLKEHEGAKTHYYDEVAVEDGEVRVGEDDCAKSLSKSKQSIDSSVIALFDPLMKSGNKPLDLNDPDDGYRYIDDNDNFEDNGISTRSDDPSNANCDKFYDIEGANWYEAIQPIDSDSSDSRNSPQLPRMSVAKESYPSQEETKESNSKSPRSLSSRRRQSELSGSFFRKLSARFKLNSIREEKQTEPKELNQASPNSSFKGSSVSLTPVELDSSACCQSHLYTQALLNKRSLSKREARIENGSLLLYNEKGEQTFELKLLKVCLICEKSDPKLTASHPNVAVFELVTLNKKYFSTPFITEDKTHLHFWMNKIAKCLISKHDHVPNEFSRAGRAYMKNQESNSWEICWLILSNRTLYYIWERSKHEKSFQVDLRKARSISKPRSSESCYKYIEGKRKIMDNQDLLVIDMKTKLYYVQFECEKLMQSWKRVLHNAAVTNGNRFQEMQLTQDDVPVIVDKCLDFIYAHGVMAEGIYRQSGSNLRITQLLEDFKSDGWSVHISVKDYSPHDVAGALKRFFRTLPEPLMTNALYNEFIKSNEISDRFAKITALLNALDKLPEINWNILKKLMGHFRTIHEFKDKSLMPIENLAPIWGPTLMQSSDDSQTFPDACNQCNVVNDLIQNYHQLFRINEEEMLKERKMKEALESILNNLNSKKYSGDMKVGVHILQKNESTASIVELTPKTTANTIVHQLCSTKNLPEKQMILFECLLDGALRRPMYATYKVIDSVLRWSNWDNEASKSNYIVLVADPFDTQSRDFTPLSSEFKFADSKSKTFRKCLCKLDRDNLICYKDSKCNNELERYKIEDLIWYEGSDPKRAHPTKWVFTFIQRTHDFKRTKDEPFYGNCICCLSEEDYKMFGALVMGPGLNGLPTYQ